MKEWFDAKIKVIDAGGKSMRVMYVKKFDEKKIVLNHQNINQRILINENKNTC